MHDVRQLLTDSEEAEHLTVVVKELLLRVHFTATERLLEVLNQVLVSLGRNGNAGLSKRVGGS